MSHDSSRGPAPASRGRPLGLSGLERRVVDAVDSDAMLALLARIVEVPSVAGAEDPAQEIVRGFMEEIGLETDAWRIDFDAVRRHPAWGADVERREGFGLVGSLGAAAGPALVLNGHVDVVPAGEIGRWSRPPWRLTVQDGRAWGRGTADMKGALSAALAAAGAISEAGVRLRGSLRIQSVIGEEDGGMGTLATLLRGHGGDAAIVLEPTGLAVAPVQAGALNFRLRIPGRAAHGALRAEGVDPIEKLLPIYRAILELEAERNRDVSDPLFADYETPFAICVGTLQAGAWASTVAESLTLEGRYGVAPDEDLDAAREQLLAAIRAAADEDPWLRDHPPELEWWGARFEPARTPADAPVVATLEGAFRDVSGREPARRGMTYGSDMRLLVREAGIPTVLFGPGDVRDAHRPDESVAIAELEATARVMAVTALRFCGAEG